MKWLTFIRSLVAIPVFLIHTFVFCVLAVIGPPFLWGPIKERWRTWVTKTWAYFVLKIFGIRLVIQGAEKVPSRNALVLFTHTSLLDIPIVFHAVPGHLRFGAKAELFKIPVFGSALAASGALKIHRGDRERVLELYQKSVKRAHAGETFVLAPEGTRQDGKALGQFKSGPFIFAMAGGLQLVPVVMAGVNNVLTKKGWLPNKDKWTRTVYLEVMGPIDTSGWPEEQRKNYQNEVREKMQATYEKLQTLVRRDEI